MLSVFPMIRQRCEMLPGDLCPPLPPSQRAEPRVALSWRTIPPAAGPGMRAGVWEDEVLLVPALWTRDQSAETRKSLQEASAVARRGLGACSSPSAAASGER